MAKNANELLQGILTVLSRIEKNIGDKETKPPTSSKSKDSINSFKNLSDFGNVKDSTKKSFVSFMTDITNIGKKGKNIDSFSDGLIKMSATLPQFIKSLQDFDKLKSERLNKTISSLDKLYDFIYQLGDPFKSKRIDRGLEKLSKIGLSLQNVTKSLNRISHFLLYLSGGIIAFSLSLVLTSKILSLSKPSDVVTFFGFTIISLVLVFGALALSNRIVSKGNTVIKDIGLGMATLALGIIAFALTIKLLPIILGGESAGSIAKSFLIITLMSGMLIGIFALFGAASTLIDKGNKTIAGMGKGLGILALGLIGFALTIRLVPFILGDSSVNDSIWTIVKIVGGLVGVFLLIGLVGGIVERGNKVVKDMGIGMATLALGIIAFALTIRLLPVILGKESNGSIIRSLLIMSGIVTAAVGMFVLMGIASSFINRGVKVVFMMSLGLVALSAAFIVMATAAKYLQGGSLTLGQQKGTEKDENKSMVLKGLGTMGLIFLASVAAFALIGIPVVAGLVITGIAVSIAMSISLMMFALSVSKLSKVARELEKQNISNQISILVGGTITGVLKGFEPLSGGKTGLLAAFEFMKNSAKIFLGLGVLMSMSLTLSMFAYAISAFAELGNMRVINGYDKNGKPIFGERIDVRNVADNIAYSIKTFLDSLLISTQTLTTNKAKALKKLGRSLTGRRGILMAIHDFADVLKTFSQFGPNGEIGYVEMVQDGNDVDGNIKFKQVQKKVKITSVVDNIVNSFGSFVDQLVKRKSLFEVSGQKGRNMMELAEVLMGSESLKIFGLTFRRNKPGLLAPISKFSEIINMYSSGAGLTIPLLNEKGEKIKDVKISEIASNIITGLTTFTDILGSAKVLTNTENAEKNIGKFSNLMESTNKIASSLDGMSKLSTSIKDLAEGIGLLAINVDKLNADKLSKILEKTASSSAKLMTSTPENEETIISNSKQSKSSIKQSELSEPDWEKISQLIGDQVGQRVAAVLRNGQFTFEFSSSKPNQGVFYLAPH